MSPKRSYWPVSHAQGDASLDMGEVRVQDVGIAEKKLEGVFGEG